MLTKALSYDILTPAQREQVDVARVKAVLAGVKEKAQWWALFPDGRFVISPRDHSLRELLDDLKLDRTPLYRGWVVSDDHEMWGPYEDG